MSLRHAERVAGITDSRTVETGDYDTIEVDYVTEGNVTKTLRLPHCLASQLRSALADELDAMTEERRKVSFPASLKRKR
jgi:anion-transporting  ArsA/GET3 family ATPase